MELSHAALAFLESVADGEPDPLTATLNRSGAPIEEAEDAVDLCVDRKWVSRDAITGDFALSWRTVADEQPRISRELTEHRVWASALRGEAGRSEGEARAAMDYIGPEMLNNAIEHSAGERLHLRILRSALGWMLLIKDDGIGAFERVREGFGLHDHDEAALELLKGKVTTDPENHSGEGIFFSCQVSDHFQLAANGTMLLKDEVRADRARVAQLGMKMEAGTLVGVEVRDRRQETIADTFRRFQGEEDQFSRTLVPMRRMAQGGLPLTSRSLARRLMHGLDKFAAVDLDFTSVESIGQGFADEVFRVWPSRHPDVQLLPMFVGPGVAQMLRHVGWSKPYVGPEGQYCLELPP